MRQPFSTPLLAAAKSWNAAPVAAIRAQAPERAVDIARARRRA